MEYQKWISDINIYFDILTETNKYFLKLLSLDLLVFNGIQCGKYHNYYIKLSEIENHTYDNYKVILSVQK